MEDRTISGLVDQVMGEVREWYVGKGRVAYSDADIAEAWAQVDRGVLVGELERACKRQCRQRAVELLKGKLHSNTVERHALEHKRSVRHLVNGEWQPSENEVERGKKLGVRQAELARQEEERQEAESDKARALAGAARWYAAEEREGIYRREEGEEEEE